MISASLLEGATHHFCFFLHFSGLSVLPPSCCHWLFAESIPIAACIHFHIARKWPGSKSRFLRCICGGFLKTGVPQIIDFKRIFHYKPSSDPHWNPRWIPVILTQQIGPEGTSRRTSRAWRRGGSFRTLSGSEQVEWPWVPYESKGLVWLSL
jgi:hypothetical protein